MRKKSFADLTESFTPERRVRINGIKENLRKECDLAELRQALSFTQTTLAETLGVGQGEISKIERRTDIYVSTLRRFLEAMGGKLEIRAIFLDHEFTITSFSSLKSHGEKKKEIVMAVKE